ncbi:hypothetical protein LTR36_008003 [Oleoguttula mirabilis]|uniref:Protein-lysine N-methyltransferase EFM4 n=1 Tax=Oleoguttula mirabilis TaxID=1507867 RepID=A0AAV9J941_9PEZI|nr:hypothetical protein LTR36_008003 [Oleoguttula mirabilis]
MTEVIGPKRTWNEGVVCKGPTLPPLRTATRTDSDSWDAAYSREIRNHDEDADDEGTVWFSESGAEEAILEQLDALEEQGMLRRALNASSGQKPSTFLDLGTGNGHLLFSLCEEDEEGKCWNGEMFGIDYSAISVQLARRIASTKAADSVRFDKWDLLSEPPGAWLRDGFDVVLDKGTFDAISLMPHSGSLRHPCDVYREKVVPLIVPGGLFVITSCNWTKDELLDWLTPQDGELQYYSEAKYPTFTFGGHTGQSIVTVVLRKGRP